MSTSRLGAILPLVLGCAALAVTAAAVYVIADAGSSRR